MDKPFEAAEEVYGEGKSKIKESYEKTQRKIDDLMKDTQQSAGRSWEDLKDYCRNHPAQALGIALGTGAIVGLALAKVFSRSESGVEQKIRRAVRNGQETWDEVKGGFEQAVDGLKGAFEAFKR